MSLEFEENSRLELHYFFYDESHTMDAFINHKCEAEFLAIAKEIFIELGIEVEILSFASKEGGKIDRYIIKSINKNSKAITTYCAIVSIFFGAIGTYKLFNPSPVPETPLQKQKIELEIEGLKTENELKKIQLEKSKKELKQISDSNTYSGNNFPDTIEYFNLNLKLIKHKSNYFQNLNTYQKVTKITTNVYLNDEVIYESPEILKEDFNKYILKTDELEPAKDEEAIIEVISPVLNNNKRARWKGVYNGIDIHFLMKDESFRRKVIRGEESFYNGYFFKCVLTHKRKLDETGNILNYDFEVSIVLGRIEDGNLIETERGKRFKALRKSIGGGPSESEQYHLF